VLRGLIACAGSGLLASAASGCEASPALAIAVLLCGRLALGAGESMGSTGATMWGINRVGIIHTARVISWNGVATYGGLAMGAPLGVALESRWGLASVGAVVTALSLAAYVLALRTPPVNVVRGAPMRFQHILRRVAPCGLGLALGGVGFGVIGAFITLYFAKRGWPGAALALSLYGALFIGARLLFAGLIGRFGGFPVAIASFLVEAAGLVLLALAPSRAAAFAGAALTGFGFSLVFPALAVEAVQPIPVEHRGTALGAYTAFVDLSLFVSGPTAGALISAFSYPVAFLWAAGSVLAAFGLTWYLAVRSS
jgi:predicted MFS family arabinose efflux permease